MKKKTIKKSWAKNRKFWILSGLLTVILIMVTAPIWFMYVVLFLFNLDDGTPSAVELKNFEQAVASSRAVIAKNEIERMKGEVLGLAVIKNASREASAYGDKCVAKHQGAVFSREFNKVCALRDTQLFTSSTSFNTLKDRLSESLKSSRFKLVVNYKNELHCVESLVEPYDKGQEVEVYIEIGTIGECEPSDPSLAYDIAYSDKPLDIYTSSYNVNDILKQSIKENRSTYISISFDRTYFDELMN